MSTDEQLRKPQRLAKGDKVGIFVPSSPVKEPYRENGLEKVRQLGYCPVEVPDILSGFDFLAKKPMAGIGDIQNFFDDVEIKALWAARGGYGSNHLLPFLSRLKVQVPKIVIGSSDVSYLLWYLLDHYNMVVFYGPMTYTSLPGDRYNVESFQCMVSGNYGDMGEIKIPGHVVLPGRVNGIITGGCLANFVSLLGTPYFPKVDGRILLLEDVGERPFRLDRMFWQLAQSGVFSRIKGLLLGQFPGCFNDKEEEENFLQRISDYLGNYNIPVIYRLPFGHSQDIHTIPLGIPFEVDTNRFEGISILETAVI